MINRKATTFQRFRVLPLSVASNLCLNQLHRGRACQQCAEICPVNAIQITPVGVTLDQDACARCGLCLRACPTEVFRETHSPELEIICQAADQITSEAIEVACPRAVFDSPPLLISRVSGATAWLMPRCLGALSPAMLLELSGMGQRPVWVHDSACSQCPIDRPCLQQNVAEANAWLRISGREPRIFMATSAEPDLDQPTRKRITLPDVSRARRAFFRQMLNPASVKNRDLVEFLPEERKRLLEQLDRPAGPLLDTRELPVTNVLINPDSCSACGLCHKFCPTEALQFVVDADLTYFALWFRPERCLDCGLCALACPEGSIYYSNEIPAEEWRQPEQICRRHSQLRRCQTCSARIAVNTPQEKCFVCRQSATRPSFLSPPV